LTIDAFARAIPHTNEAARKAHAEADAHQHTFGLPHIFLTVTPDDENNFLVEVSSGQSNTTCQSPGESKSDKQLTIEAKNQSAIRFQFPGLWDFFYDTVVDIAVEEIIGWNWKAGKAMKSGGLFGIPQAYTHLALKSRLSKHYICTYRSGLRSWRCYAGGHFGDATLSSTIEAKDELCRYIDGIASTALDNCFHSTKKAYTACFLCGNDDCKCRRLMPKVVDDQQHQNL